MTQGRRGQVTPRQLPDGRWHVKVRLGSDPGTGAAVRQSVYGRTEAAAMDEAIRRQSDYRRGLVSGADAGRQSLAAYLDGWLEESIRPRRTPNTYARYRRAVDQHIVPYLGRVRLDRLTPGQVEGLLTRLSAAGRRPRHWKEVEAGMPPGLAPASVLLVRAVLRRALTQAVRRGEVTRNVAALVEPPTAVRATASSLSDDEARRLLAAAHGTRLEAIVTVALAMGLRQGEALGLCWTDIDVEAGELRVRRQLQRVNSDWALVDLKSPTSRRDLPLPAVVVAALHAHRVEQARCRVGLGRDWTGSPWPLVFPSSVGTPWSPRNLTRSFKALLEDAGLPTTLAWHELRHSAGSLLHARGVDLATIQVILGHSSIAVTANVYTHVATTTKRAAARAMDDALSPPRAATGG